MKIDLRYPLELVLHVYIGVSQAQRMIVSTYHRICLVSLCRY